MSGMGLERFRDTGQVIDLPRFWVNISIEWVVFSLEMHSLNVYRRIFMLNIN